MALLYGYLFPLIFLVAFMVLYRHEKIPALRHLGELLTISVLGGACFGLPTTLVSERERGVWRRYRLVPVPTWALLTGTVAARYLLVLSAGLLQVAVALAAGMTFPGHPFGLLAAFTLVSFAFIGLGLVIAALADTVPAVQALGQCLFLPMLIIGGVAVPLTSLPDWAQHLSAFFPGRYAVEILQANVTGAGLPAARFSALALTLIGCAACVMGAKFFRWDVRERGPRSTGRWWVALALIAWLAVGVMAEWRGHIAPVAIDATPSAPAPRWTTMTSNDVASLDFNLPPDDGVVTPINPEQAEDYLGRQVERVRAGLPTWQPGLDPDDVQRVRNLLCVAAVPDLTQMPVEGYLPLVVFDYLRTKYSKDDLIKILTWIALHPAEGTVRTDLNELGLKATTADREQVRERSAIYAVKFIARLTGRPIE